METSYANPGRVDSEVLASQIHCFFASPLSSLLLETVGGFLLVLNPQRQILAASPEFLALLRVQEETLEGLRLGEALHCVNAKGHPGGCGASGHCVYCGALLSMLASQMDRKRAEGECRLLMRHGGKLVAAEFLVRASPLDCGEETFLAVALLDISSRKRKESLERIFQHDLVNSVQCLEGWMENLEAGHGDQARTISVLASLVRRLSSQVRGHRILMQAERGELHTSFQRLRVAEVLEDLRQQFEMHAMARERVLEIRAPEKDDCVVSDREILQRVITNMIMNALEATAPGGHVQIWYEPEGGQPGFHVKNPGAIPVDVAMQIFQRSFSTKREEGHGLGTYGMKLLGEEYLGGRLTFRSTAADGTRFTILLPRIPPPAASRDRVDPGMESASR